MTKIIKNLLRDEGYEIIALPRETVTPLSLLCKQEGYLTEYGGGLLELFEPDLAGLPIVETITPNIKGTQALTTEFSTGINLLSGIFKALRLKDSDLNTKLKAAKGLELTFSFQNIKEEKVSYMGLDNFLVGAIPKKEGFERSLEKLKDSDLYVVTSVLKSNNISITLGSSSEQQAGVDAALEEVAELSAQLQRNRANELSIQTVDEKKPLAFAYRAAKILFNKKKWFEFWQKEEAGFRIKNQEGMVLKGPEDFPIVPLQTAEGISNF